MTPLTLVDNLRGEPRTNPQPAALYAAIRETVYGGRSRAKVIAAALDCPVKTVYDVADPTTAKHLKAYHIPTFVQVTGCYAIPDYLEAQIGRAAVAQHEPRIQVVMQVLSVLAIADPEAFGHLCVVIEAMAGAVSDAL